MYVLRNHLNKGSDDLRVIWDAMALIWRHYNEYDDTIRNSVGQCPLRALVFTLIARFMGPTWGPSGADTGGPHLGPMNFAIWATITSSLHCPSHQFKCTHANWKFHEYDVTGKERYFVERIRTYKQNPTERHQYFFKTHICPVVKMMTDCLDIPAL